MNIELCKILKKNERQFVSLMFKNALFLSISYRLILLGILDVLENSSGKLVLL